MVNVALDIDKYVSHSTKFRNLSNVEPIEGIILLKEKNLINDSSNDSSIDEIKSPTVKESAYNKMFAFNVEGKNVTTNNDCNKEEKIKSEKLENNVIKKNNNHDIHVIAEEGKNEFLLTGMKFDKSKKNFFDFDMEMITTNESKQSKYLPPLTKRSSYFKNKNIRIGDNLDTEDLKSPDINESIFYL